MCIRDRSLTACSGGDEKQESYTGKAYESEILTPGEIVVGVSADYPPYESLNPSTGELEGFDIDMTETLATYMGAEGKEVKVVWKQMEFATIITEMCIRDRPGAVLRCSGPGLQRCPGSAWCGPPLPHR